MTDYPKPATPLPWGYIPSGFYEGMSTDKMYIIHTANAFPHLVGALEAVKPHINMLNWNSEHEFDWLEQQVRDALAIALGEVKP